MNKINFKYQKLEARGVTLAIVFVLSFLADELLFRVMGYNRASIGYMLLMILFPFLYIEFVHCRIGKFYAREGTAAMDNRNLIIHTQRKEQVIALDSIQDVTCSMRTIYKCKFAELIIVYKMANKKQQYVLHSSDMDKKEESLQNNPVWTMFNKIETKRKEHRGE
jgi:hypothetical protein